MTTDETTPAAKQVEDFIWWIETWMPLFLSWSIHFLFALFYILLRLITPRDVYFKSHPLYRFVRFFKC